MAINYLKSKLVDGTITEDFVRESFLYAITPLGEQKEGLTRCWALQDTTTVNTGGYGSIMLAGQQIQLHRLSWWLNNGMPEMTHTMCVRHKCDNPACANPEHLEIGSHSDNVKDMYERGRHKVGRKPRIRASVACNACRAYRREPCKPTDSGACERCVRLGLECVIEERHRSGYEFKSGECSGENNAHCKVSNAQIEEIKALRAAGKKVKDIAAIYGISPAYTSSIINDKIKRKI